MIKTIQKKTVNLQRVRTETEHMQPRTVRWNKLAQNRTGKKTEGGSIANSLAWKIKKKQNQKEKGGFITRSFIKTATTHAVKITENSVAS